MTLQIHTSHFAHNWKAALSSRPPLILPALQVLLPRQVPGEEEALHRGALYLDVKPASGASFLATCALGFQEATLPSGLWSCPNADHLLALAGGYAYLIPASRPTWAEFLPLRPVCTVRPAPAHNLLLLGGFHTVHALGPQGLLWHTERLSWEGVTLGEVRDGVLHGTGWNMFSDRDIPFQIDLQTGKHQGGGYSSPASPTR